MKTTLTVILGLLLGAGLVASDDPAGPAPQHKFTWIGADDPTTAAIRELGAETIGQVGGAMLMEVSHELAAVGPEKAVAVLHLKNFILPAAAPGGPRVVAVKRTSLRVRNRANLPDNADLAALLSIQTALMDGDDLPALLVQRLDATASTPVEWRVYRPIGINRQCLVCHGKADQLAPGVPARLAALYPEDKAVNYSASDWRGVIRVSIVDPAAAATSNPKPVSSP